MVVCFQKLNIGYNLIEASNLLTKPKGFVKAHAGLTGPVSQHIWIDKHGYTEIGELKYRDFEYEGQRPLAIITDCESFNQVVADISPPVFLPYPFKELMKQTALLFSYYILKKGNSRSEKCNHRLETGRHVI